MANKKFPIFLHAGRGNRKGERSLQLSITFMFRSFGLKNAIDLIAQSVKRQTMDLKVAGTNPVNATFFFFCIFLSS